MSFLRRWLRDCASVGADPQLHGRPTIEIDGGQLRIGSRFRLASRPVTSHLSAGMGAILEIGDDVSIGHGGAIAAFQHVKIGDETRIGPFVIIMDTNFHDSSGEQSLSHETRPVLIGRGCYVGSRVTITRGVVIGDGVEILAGSVVSSAIPPGVCVAGARARIIGRACDRLSRWDSVAAALPEILMEALGMDAPPDIDSRSIPATVRTESRLRTLVRTLEERFDVALPANTAGDVETFAELAAVVQTAIDARSPLA